MATFSEVIEMNTEQLEGLLSEVLAANGKITKNVTFWNVEECERIKDIRVRIDYIEKPMVLGRDTNEN